jgi:hypothetical protein
MGLMLRRMLVVLGALLALAAWSIAPAAALAGEGCSNEALREQQGSQFLPGCRAYEMVSPPEKLGTDVSAESSRTHASLGESPGLPAAVSFLTLGGFGDVQGTGIGVEYLAQRTGAAGTSGWATHAITPRQDPLTLFATARLLDPRYEAFSDDLSSGVFKAWTPLTEAPNVAEVDNLYLRDDLRTPGAGSFQLLTNAPSPLPASTPKDFIVPRPVVAGASRDLRRVVFESAQDLTAGATGKYLKLYESDGATVRLLAAGPGCPGALKFALFPPGPCSIAGLGASFPNYVPGAVSTDGSRVEFTAPVNAISRTPANAPGAASRVFQFDNGTGANGEALIQLDTSEKASPDVTQEAFYQTASADGSRVFFTSSEHLTEAPSGGLYMWARQPSDEAQSVTVDASGGTFQLTFHSQLTHGVGTLSEGSNVVGSLEGSFAEGQTIVGAGIPAGTTVTGVGSNGTMTLSQSATGEGEQALDASIDATTAPLPFDASAAQVQGALEGLAGIGAGNVTVTGGPGGAGGGAAYVVTFTGALAGVDVAQLSADGTALSGGGASASVVMTQAVRNLTLIGPDVPASQQGGVMGASADGHRVYFISGSGQIVPGGPPVSQAGIYYWQDADGTPGGTLSFVGGLLTNDVSTNIGTIHFQVPMSSRVTPDGRFLLFQAADGSQLRPGVDQTGCAGQENATDNGSAGCAEVYLYSADGSTPTEPDLVCVSCAPGGAPETANAWINVRVGAGGEAPSAHLSRALSDDGRRVFFWTAEPLVPQDTNGRADVYEYDMASGTVHLLSGGDEPTDSYFLDSSGDGQDAYFATRERLLRWDTDTSVDIYDARVGGGFPQPALPVQQCVGEACHGALTGVPLLGAPASLSFHGAGNLARPAGSHAGSRPSRARRLARALRSCHSKHSRRKRRRCEARVRRRFAKATRDGRAL